MKERHQDLLSIASLQTPLSTQHNRTNMASREFTVQSANHTGFTVTSLDKALAFWHDLLGLPVLYRKELEMGPLHNAVGLANAKINAAVVSLDGGHRVELLEYTTPGDGTTLIPRPCDVGSVHLAINVTKSRNLIAAAKELGWTPAADEPQRRKMGDGSTRDVVYIRSEDGVTVELMEIIED